VGQRLRPRSTGRESSRKSWLPVACFAIPSRDRTRRRLGRSLDQHGHEVPAADRGRESAQVALALAWTERSNVSGSTILVDAISLRARSFQPIARPRSSRTSLTSPVQVCSSTFTLRPWLARNRPLSPFCGFEPAEATSAPPRARVAS
jgi:hypothetical protein